MCLYPNKEVQSISEYYRELVEIFRELDHCDKVTMKDPKDVKSYHDAIERLRVHTSWQD